MNWSEVMAWAGVIFLLLGSMLTLLTSLGILHFNSTFARMHACAKPQSFGIGLLGLGMICTMQSVKATCVAVLIIALQYLTVPISSQMLGRAAYRSGNAENDPLIIIDEHLPDIDRTSDKASEKVE